MTRLGGNDLVFAGIQPVLQMPFEDTAEQAIIKDELTALVEHLVAEEVDGLVVPGLASESWALTERERDEVVELVAEAIGGRARLIVGIDGATAVATDRACRAAARGADGVMVLPPAQATTDAGIVRHFAAVAEAGGVPVLMQDSPQVTGVRLTIEAISAAVTAHPLVGSLKVEIPGSGPKTSAAHDAGVEIVAGWGGIGYLEQIERGAIGCMPGSDLGPALLAIDSAARKGDQEGALAIYRQILPLLSFQTTSVQQLVLSAKRHLRRAGVFTTASLRAPGRDFDAWEAATLDALLDELADQGTPGFTG